MIDHHDIHCIRREERWEITLIPGYGTRVAKRCNGSRHIHV
jgi:hypothetical protein